MTTPLINPLLAKIKLPGRVFQLPSKGIFYKEGEVLAKHISNGEINVSPLSALAEMKLRSADLLYSGKILREICAECVPDIVNPGKLVSKDIDALFTFLRIATYGPTMTATVAHNCKDATQHSYNINVEEVIHDPRNAILKHAATIYTVTLSNGQVVKLSPSIYDEALAVLHLKLEQERKAMATNQKPSDEELEELTIKDLLSVIIGVHNDAESELITDRKFLAEWVRLLPKAINRELFDAITKADDWGFEYVAKLKCKDCGETFNYQLDLNPINFFFG